MTNLPIDFELKLRDYTENHLASRNLSEATRQEYVKDISQLLHFLASTGSTEPQNVNLTHLEAFLAEMDKEGSMFFGREDRPRGNLSGASRVRKTSSVKSFFGWLEQSGYIPRDISKRLIPPRKENKIPRVLSEREYKALELAVANEPKAAAIIELLLQTGIRLSELANLRIGDIDLPNKVTKDENAVGELFVRKGKGRRERMVSLNYKACQALKTWLRVRPELERVDTVFVSKFKRPMTPGGIQWLVGKYLEEAGVMGAHVHSLRHTFATHMVKNGARLPTVRDMLGHNSLDTTSIYVSLARDQMNKDVQNYAL